MNVALPVLPLHGARRVTRVSGEPFLSFELMNAVHGLTQAVWDLRRLISWIRSQGATSISLFGVSLGGYTVALLAGLEPGLDGVVAGIPVADFPGLFHATQPATHPGPGDRAPHHGRHGRERLPGGVTAVLRPVGGSRPPLHLRRLRRPAGHARPGTAPGRALG